MGELVRRKREDRVLRRVFQRGRARQTVAALFAQVYATLKEANKEKWAARVIGKWWRKIQVRLRELDRERWLPLDIDPDTANFGDVTRVLRVLDDYALEKLA